MAPNHQTTEPPDHQSNKRQNSGSTELPHQTTKQRNYDTLRKTLTQRNYETMKQLPNFEATKTRTTKLLNHRRIQQTAKPPELGIQTKKFTKLTKLLNHKTNHTL